MAWSLDPSSPRRDHTIKCTTPSNRSLYSSPVRTYLTILRIPAVRSALVLGLIVRIPMWAASIILTLHVVGHLGRSYGQAGIVIAAATIAVAISGPWRGRLLDQRGLRRSTWPNLIVLTLCWLIAPWVGYWPLIGFVFIAGLFVVPTFSILRQVQVANVPDELRKASLVLDAVLVEISFMIGPVLGVLMAHWWQTPIALLVAELTSVLGCALLWIVNPPLGQSAETRAERHPVRSWLNLRVLAIMAAAGSAVLVLTGTDLSIVAALRALDMSGSIGWMLAIWGAGSAVGGLIYGAQKRHPPLMLLLGLLGATTAAVTIAQDRLWLAVLLFVCGAFCAPTMTAAIDALMREVPLAVRGEAMGWHSSWITAASAIGAPLIGFALDLGGWHLGFITAGTIGVAIAAVGWLLAPGTGASHEVDPTLPSADEVEARALGQG